MKKLRNEMYHRYLFYKIHVIIYDENTKSAENPAIFAKHKRPHNFPTNDKL